jgi:hypothetical protein
VSGKNLDKLRVVVACVWYILYKFVGLIDNNCIYTKSEKVFAKIFLIIKLNSEDQIYSLSY